MATELKRFIKFILIFGITVSLVLQVTPNIPFKAFVPITITLQILKFIQVSRGNERMKNSREPGRITTLIICIPKLLRLLNCVGHQKHIVDMEMEQMPVNMI